MLVVAVHATREPDESRFELLFRRTGPIAHSRIGTDTTVVLLPFRCMEINCLVEQEETACPEHGQTGVEADVKDDEFD